MCQIICCFSYTTGGIIFVAIDFDRLGEYVRINPRARTLDALLEILVESGFISEEVTERCIVEGTFTDNGGLEVTLTAVDPDADAEFCNEQSEIIANNINDPVNAPPEVLQFAGAAVTAPQISEEEEGGPSGAAELAFSCLTLLVATVFALFF